MSTDTPPKRYTLDEIRTMVRNLQRPAAHAAEKTRRVAARLRKLLDAIKALDSSAMPETFRQALLTEVEKMHQDAWDAFGGSPDFPLFKLRQVLGEKAKR